MDYTSRHQRDEVWHLLQARRRLGDDLLGHLDLAELSLPVFEAHGTTFRDTCLVKANLAESRWLECTFLGAELRQAKLRGALFEACHFDQARLMELDLCDGTLADSSLRGAYLSRMGFEGGKAARCVFDGCDFTAANFRETRLIHCQFTAPRQLGGANLARLDLRGAILIDCNLKEANLREAKLSGATFVSCDLRGVNAVESELADASLIACNAEGINLVNAKREGLRHAATRFFHAKT